MILRATLTNVTDAPQQVAPLLDTIFDRFEVTVTTPEGLTMVPAWSGKMMGGAPAIVFDGAGEVRTYAWQAGAGRFVLDPSKSSSPKPVAPPQATASAAPASQSAPAAPPAPRYAPAPQSEPADAYEADPASPESAGTAYETETAEAEDEAGRKLSWRERRQMRRQKRMKELQAQGQNLIPWMR